MTIHGQSPSAMMSKTWTTLGWVSRLATLIESFAFQDVRKATKPADDARHLVVDTEDGVRLHAADEDEKTFALLVTAVVAAGG